MKKLLLGAVSAAALLFTANAASANCDDGEMVIKFSHVVKATGHPKGDAATLLAERVNKDMNGKACMEVFPNSTLFDDDKVMEALLLGDVQLRLHHRCRSSRPTRSSIACSICRSCGRT
jgi:C4-dicarboxylate-binding protein DctP